MSGKVDVSASQWTLDSPRLIVVGLGSGAIGALFGSALFFSVLGLGLIAVVAYRLAPAEPFFRYVALTSVAVIALRAVRWFVPAGPTTEVWYLSEMPEIIAALVGALALAGLFWVVFTAFMRLAEGAGLAQAASGLWSSRLYVVVAGALVDAVHIGTSLAAKTGNAIEAWVMEPENTEFLGLVLQVLSAASGLALLLGVVRLWRAASALHPGVQATLAHG